MLADAPVAAEQEARVDYEILDRMGNTGNLASTAPHLGDILYAQGRYDEAYQLSEFTERITIEGDVDAEGAVARTPGEDARRQGRHDEAERFARDAVGIAAPTDYLDLHADALEALAEVLRLADRNADASATLREALELRGRKGNLVGAARARRLLAELGS